MSKSRTRMSRTVPAIPGSGNFTGREVVVPASPASPAVLAGRQRPKPVALPGQSAPSPQTVMVAAEAAELAAAARAVAAMSGGEKYSLRGELLFKYKENMPSGIKSALCRRPQDADVEQLTLAGHFDEALAQAFAWRERYIASVLAAQAAEEARLNRDVAESKVAAEAAAVAEELRLAEAIACYSKTVDAPVTVGGVVLPPVTQTGKVTHIASQEPFVSPRQKAWRERRGQQGDSGKPPQLPKWLSADLRRELEEARTGAPASDDVIQEAQAPKAPKAKRTGPSPAERKRINKRASTLRCMVAKLGAFNKWNLLQGYGPEEQELFNFVLAEGFDPAAQDSDWLREVINFLEKILEEVEAEVTQLRAAQKAA